MKKPFRKKSSPQPVSNILSSLLKDKNLNKRIESCKAIDIWDSVVGGKIAERTSPFAIKNGVMKVTVSDHAWLQELQFMKEEIRKRLNETLGKESVQNLYFKVGSLQEKEVEAPSITEQLKKVRLNAKEKEDVEKVVCNIENNEIKVAIRKVLVKEARRRKLAKGGD